MDFLAKMGGKCLCQETIGGAFCPTTGDNRWSKRKSERFPTEQPPIREGAINIFLPYLEADSFSGYISSLLSFENFTLQGV